MKRLFFGPTNSTGILQHEVSKALAGLKGCTSIQGRIIVYAYRISPRTTSSQWDSATPRLSSIPAVEIKLKPDSNPNRASDAAALFTNLTT